VRCERAGRRRRGRPRPAHVRSGPPRELPGTQRRRPLSPRGYRGTRPAPMHTLAGRPRPRRVALAAARLSLSRPPSSQCNVWLRRGDGSLCRARTRGLFCQPAGPGVCPRMLLGTRETTSNSRCTYVYVVPDLTLFSVASSPPCVCVRRIIGHHPPAYRGYDVLWSCGRN
jgi:hypothetical protein